MLDECHLKKKFVCRCTPAITLEERINSKGVFCEVNCIKRFDLRIEEQGLEYHFEDDYENKYNYYCKGCGNELIYKEDD